ncbi:hypothetical protein PHMEG_00026463 [Phytophthora megakarya]|uniref:Cytochrome P450 n=1 Tax=Phytophthora megakarya TaxID=4795 RepID=A0A225VB89_9STRA|nr:hypothetical protein PHMEG_00026463 [Phytophthora megakarya]
MTATAFAAIYSIRRKSNKPDNVVHVPFLAGIPLLGNTMELLANTPRLLDWVVERTQEYGGNPFAVKILGKNDMIYTSKPEHFEQVLREQSSNFDRGDVLHDVFADFMGENILLVNGDRWKYHRKVLVNLFSARALRDFMTPIIQKNIRVLQDILSQTSETEHPIDFHKLINKFTLETFAEIGFGRKLGKLTSPDDHPFELAFDEANHISANRLTAPTWLWKLQRWLNVGDQRRLREDMVVINEFLMDTIATMMDRRESNDQPANRDILSIILDTMKSSGQTITPADIRDIVFTGMIAGRDTTADTLSWLVHVLHYHPQVVEKLCEEIRTKLPKFAESETSELVESETYVPSMEEVQGLPYLEATIRELLRLYPAAPHVGYHCIRDTVFPDGTFIPADASIILAFYSAARLESAWGSDAASFVPERFLDKESGEVLQMPPTKFVAFSAGPRVCVGRNLALLELKLVTSCLVNRFRLKEVSGQEVTYRRGVTIGMKNPLLMKVERVAVSPAAKA